MNKTPIYDWILFSPTKQHILEAKENFKQTGRYIVRGIMQRAESPNQNGRIYPRAILEREVKNYLSVFVKEKRAFGELDHPDSSIVMGKNASHTVENLWWEGNDLWGEIEVLDTPNGLIVQEIINKGKTLGISSRGLGSVKRIDEQTVEVQDDFELICWDFVTNPSTHRAFQFKVNENAVSKNDVEILQESIFINDKYKDLRSIVNSILNG